MIHVGAGRTKINGGNGKAGVAPFAPANETNVTATLVDIGGTKWPSAFCIVIFVPPPNIPPPYLWAGGPFLQYSTFQADPNGYFNINLADNTTITPPNSMWQFIISPNATMPAVVFNLMIAGTSMDISSIFTSQSYQVQSTLVQSFVLPRAYTDTEVAFPPFPGALYYDATDHQLRMFTGGGGWVSMLGGGWKSMPAGTDANTLVGGFFQTPGFFVNGPPTTPQTNQVISNTDLYQIGFSTNDTTGQIYIRTWAAGAWLTWRLI